ncbi:eukaryotic translation initiation factor [Klebsormidium nitens]|uniref:Eukaryotic translation initiation factor 3 subunit F n=1 Tax=Klebsormidium nitens TaxID=105231 RepID=A0A0U9HHQ1_KLENI|nr:eukaryotic translation initiation factor [Klebsormidium nitens]|eukprot:GAQ77950.1 eukaryotic translation initiation factor [Klebsormidium nitens]
MGDLSVLHLPSGPTAAVAKLHPVVLFNISDAYIRRNEGQERVIGTLLGTVSSDGTVEIKNSYAVPHKETSDEVAVDIDFHQRMFDLHHQVNPKEAIVGWYSTGAGVSVSDALIQDFYSREANNAILLTVDTAFTTEKLKLKAFVSTPVQLGDRQLAAQFHEIQLDLRLVEAERVGFEVLKETQTDRLPNEIEGLEATVERLRGMVDTVAQYVNKVVDGKIPADNTIGRYLADTVAVVPRINPESFDSLFNDSVQDMLLVLYLANLTRTQLALAEKLNTASAPV